ncbi:anti-sigma-D factor RsdA [Rhodococcus sp. UNC363MFTsu5.1]|uniref:anti-sigma-D factor RsdA n=1 Tax=Rhodococcus sp. UNC363MFTsu5.1 TaxID=1449069 RepID=UPI0009DCFB4B|nr:anti-sigma-D factor RsdA [Rhodococcus sp. UNC363MFTsu5.1]
MARGSKRGGDHEGTRRDTSGADLTPDASSLDDTDASSADATAVDFAAIARDDALIDAIAGDGPIATNSPEEFELATLLTAWRAEILAPAMPAEPDLDQVAAAVDRELATIGSPRRSGLRLLRPIVGAAAAIAVVMAGLTVFSYNAVPGDPLWKVKEVVFTERANSTVAGIDTTTNLEEAERLIRAGDPQAALVVLESARKRVDDVNESAKRDELTAWRERLVADAVKTPPTTTTPPSAPGTSPGLPAVPGVTLPGDTVTAPVLPTTVLDLPSLPTTVPPVETGVPPITVPPITIPPTQVPPITIPPIVTTQPPVLTTVPSVPTTTKVVPPTQDTPTPRDLTSNPPPS